MLDEPTEKIVLDPLTKRQVRRCMARGLTDAEAIQPDLKEGVKKVFKRELVRLAEDLTEATSGNIKENTKDHLKSKR